MTFTSKALLERTSRRSHAAPEHGRAPGSAYPEVSAVDSGVVRRKASCACGGGCPRCREQHTLQTKLQINTPGDMFEREADRVAEAVVSGSSAGGVHVQSPVGLQRKCACGGAAGAETCTASQEEEKEESLQMAAENSAASVQEFAPPIVHDVLGSPGRPLDPATRAFFEPRLGRDFSDVRVHTDTQAAESARAINALAYTVGRDVVFGSGQFAPSTAAGGRLLAHELTHVIQQSDHRAQRLQRQVSPASAHLQSPRFSPSAKLERCFEDKDRLGQGDPDTDAVMRIQQALIDVQQITGNTYDLGSTGPNNDGVDGNYGPKTVAAVKKFKADENLGFTQSGDVGPGTMHRLDELFLAKPTPAQDPVFRIDGVLKPSAVKDTREFISTLQSVQFMGDFTLDAKGAVQTVRPSDADDWQVGIVQTVASPIHQTCFRFPQGVTPPPGHPHPTEVFVGNLKKLPGFLVPDRDDSSPIFMTASTGTDMASVHSGRTSFSVPLHAEDHPRTGHQNSLFSITQDGADGQVQLFHQHRFGFMLTHVIARQISSGRVIPLHTVEWFMFIDVNYDPSPGGGFPPTSHVQEHRFDLISSHPFSSSDVPPVVGGPAIRSFSKQEGEWKPRCPPF